MGRGGFALGAAVPAAMVVLLRSRLIPTMDQISARIQTRDSMAIQRFRRVHLVGLLINLGPLILLVWALTKLSL